MSLQVRFKPDAREDIDSQARFLVENATVEVAMKFVDAVHQTAEMLATQPELGERLTTASQYSAEYRRWSVRGFREYLMFYRQIGETLEVARLLHAKRDITDVAF